MNPKYTLFDWREWYPGEAKIVKQKELDPALNALFRYTCLIDLVETLVISVSHEKYTEQIASKTPNAPHDASSFEFLRGSFSVVVEGGSSNVSVEVDGTIMRFLFERPSVLLSRCGRECRDLPIAAFQSGVTRTGGAASSARRTQTASSTAEVKSNVAPFF